MPRNIYQQAYLTPDLGELKGEDTEWANIQNFRGWGNLISRRRGVRNSMVLPSGVMGIHDLLVDDDPTSLDKIVIPLYNGSLVFADYNEIYTAFTYLFTGSAQLAIQSPDGNWWDITPDANGAINATVIATPSTTISTDLDLGVNDLFGFLKSTVIYSMTVNSLGMVEINTFNLAGSETEYSTTQAFVNGVGPIFTDGNLVRWRLGIDNSGSLITSAT